MLNDRQRQFIVRPFEVLERSSRLIDNVRKLQRLRSGEFRVNQVDLLRVLTGAIKEFQGVPDNRITFSCNGETNYYVLANDLLHDVFVNLIGNAIKHTGTGEARIMVSLGHVDEDNSRFYRVSVEDNGRGIPDDLKVAIFNRMSRGPTKAKGTGLGLYLARSLIDSYHGRIWVEDRVPGDHTKGARFVVLLPAVGQ
jgi:signal transduction histidine kinase